MVAMGKKESKMGTNTVACLSGGGRESLHTPWGRRSLQCFRFLTSWRAGALGRAR